MDVEAIFYAGAGRTESTSELGGVQAVISCNGKPSLLIDPGVPPDRFNEIYGFPSKPRVMNRLPELEALGLLPNIEGIWRLDDEYLRGRRPQKSEIEILATHSHIDHIGLLTYMRPDVPVWMDNLSMKIAHCWQHRFAGGRTLNQFVDYYDQLSSVANTLGGSRAAFGDEAVIPRDIRNFQDEIPFEAGGLNVTAYPVDHSVIAYGFIIETEIGNIGWSGDLRLRGRRPGSTRKFVKALKDRDVKYLFWEGSLLHFDHRGNEEDVTFALTEYVRGKNFVGIAYPPRDCDRMTSVYNAAKTAGRTLLIPPEQAELLNAMNGAHGFPEMDWENIAVLIPMKGSRANYPKWMEKYLDSKHWEGPAKGLKHATLEDLAQNQDAFLPYMPYSYMPWMLEKVRPKPNSGYIRSHPEPYTKEMEEAERRIINLMRNYGITFEEKEYFFKPGVKQKIPTFHVTGHLNWQENEEIMESLNPDTTIIPFHGTEPIKHFRDGVAKHLKVRVPIRGQPLVLGKAA